MSSWLTNLFASSTTKTTYEGMKCLTRRYTLLFLLLYFILNTLLLILYHTGYFSYRSISPIWIVIAINMMSFLAISSLYLFNLEHIHQKLTGSLQSLIQAIRSLRPEHPATPLSVTHLECHDELHAVVDAINDKSQQIQDHINYLKEFIGYVQHEFNTPLAIIELEIERLQTTSPDINPMLVSIREELTHMRSLATSITALINEDICEKTEKHVVDIVPMIEKINREVEQFYKDSTISLSGNHSSSQETIAPYAHIIFRNIIENAVKHGSANIDVVVKENSVTIRDFGSGIGSSDLAKIRLPFWRKPGSGLGGATQQGFGLGLPLVKKIADKLGREIFVHSEDTGTTFTLLFH